MGAPVDDLGLSLLRFPPYVPLLPHLLLFLFLFLFLFLLFLLPLLPLPLNDCLTDIITIARENLATPPSSVYLYRTYSELGTVGDYCSRLPHSHSPCFFVSTNFNVAMKSS